MSADEITKVRVNICGEEHLIKGEASQEYIAHLAAMVDEQMMAIREKHPNLNRHRLAILAAVNLADELERLRKKHAELLELIEEG